MTGCTGLSIYNNIINANCSEDAVAFWWPSYNSNCGQTWVMPHSVTAFNNSFSSFLNLNGSIYNNICSQLITDGSSLVSNNVFYNPQTNCTRTTYLPGANTSSVVLESGNGNLFSVSQNSLFTGTNFNPDTSWHLKPTAVAIGAGTGGVDAGATGGTNPYVFGAQPAIPAIYKLNVAPAANGSTISVTTSTRSNN